MAKDKVLGLKIGTHEADFLSQQEKENNITLPKETKHDLLNNGFLS